MGRKGADKKTKRSKAPAFWAIKRKAYQFTITTLPGPHPKSMSYPLAVFLRDIFKLVKTYREAKYLIFEGKIKVDGVIRKKPDFPLGLMDVIEIPTIGKTYRLVPTTSVPLAPIEISDKEKSLKICKIKVKRIIKDKKIQYGLHDGRSLLLDNQELRPGDSCLIEVPSQKMINSVKLSEGALVLVTKGKKVGQIGKIKQIKQGTFSRQKMIDITLGETSTELPLEMVIAIGDKNPLVSISESVRNG